MQNTCIIVYVVSVINLLSSFKCSGKQACITHYNFEFLFKPIKTANLVCNQEYEPDGTDNFLKALNSSCPDALGGSLISSANPFTNYTITLNLDCGGEKSDGLTESIQVTTPTNLTASHGIESSIDSKWTNPPTTIGIYDYYETIIIYYHKSGADEK